MKKNFCVNCEVRGLEVEAEVYATILGDKIPLCRECYEEFLNASLIELDEDDKD